MDNKYLTKIAGWGTLGHLAVDSIDDVALYEANKRRKQNAANQPLPRDSVAPVSDQTKEAQMVQAANGLKGIRARQGAYTKNMDHMPTHLAKAASEERVWWKKDPDAPPATPAQQGAAIGASVGTLSNALINPYEGSSLKEHIITSGKRVLGGAAVGAAIGKGYQLYRDKVSPETKRKQKASLATTAGAAAGATAAAVVGSVPALVAHHAKSSRDSVSAETIHHMLNSPGMDGIKVEGYRGKDVDPKFLDGVPKGGREGYQAHYSPVDHRVVIDSADRATLGHELGHAIDLRGGKAAKLLSLAASKSIIKYPTTAVMAYRDDTRDKVPAYLAVSNGLGIAREAAANKHLYDSVKHIQGARAARGALLKYIAPQMAGYVVPGVAEPLIAKKIIDKFPAHEKAASEDERSRATPYTLGTGIGATAGFVGGTLHPVSSIGMLSDVLYMRPMQKLREQEGRIADAEWWKGKRKAFYSDVSQRLWLPGAAIGAGVGLAGTAMWDALREKRAGLVSDTIDHAADVVHGTGTLLGKAMNHVSGKNIYTYLAAKKGLNTPAKLHAATHVMENGKERSMTDGELLSHFSPGSKEHGELNSLMNQRKASRALAVGGVGLAAYKSNQENDRGNMSY